MGNEEHGLSAGLHVGESALRETADFIGSTLDPFGAVGSSLEVFVFKRGASDGINDGVGRVGCREKREVGCWQSMLEEGAGLVGRMAGGGKTRGACGGALAATGTRVGRMPGQRAWA